MRLTFSCHLTIVGDISDCSNRRMLLVSGGSVKARDFAKHFIMHRMAPH